jgi:hypothetical protein
MHHFCSALTHSCGTPHGRLYGIHSKRLRRRGPDSETKIRWSPSIVRSSSFLIMSEPGSTGRQTVTHRGNCHCAAFKFTATVSSPLKPVDICNCSYCVKIDARWMRYEDIKIERGEGTLKEYHFATNKSGFQVRSRRGFLQESKKSLSCLLRSSVLLVGPPSWPRRFTSM